MIATPATASTVPTIVRQLCRSLKIQYVIGKRKIGGKAINVEAMPMWAYLIAIMDSQMPKKGPKIEPPMMAQRALRLVQN